MSLCQPALADDRHDVSFAVDTIQYSLAALSRGGNLPPDAYSAASNALFLALDKLERAQDHEALAMIVLVGAMRLDGAFSEEQNCVVLRKGDKLKRALDKAKNNPADLAAECRRRAASIGVNASSVCAMPDEVASRAARQINAIAAHSKCSE